MTRRCRFLRTPLAVATLCGLAFAADPASAQRPMPRGNAHLTGTVTQTGTGAVIVRGTVCVEPVGGYKQGQYHGCGATDSVGRYLIDDIPSGTWALVARCHGRSIFSGDHLGNAQMVIRNGSRHSWNVVAPATRCDQRPLLRESGEFTGDYYTDHFETAWFFIDGRELVATADFTDAHAAGFPPILPAADSTRDNGSCYRMTVEGSMAGPYEDVGRPIAHHRMLITRVIRRQAVDSMICVAHVDRVLPGHSDPPPPSHVVSDGVTAFLVARHRLTRQQPVVIICGTLETMAPATEIDRVRDNTRNVAVLVSVDADCTTSLRRGDRGPDGIVLVIEDVHANPEATSGPIIRGKSSTRDGMMTRETGIRTFYRGMSVTFGAPEKLP